MGPTPTTTGDELDSDNEFDHGMEEGSSQGPMSFYSMSFTPAPAQTPT